MKMGSNTTPMGTLDNLLGDNEPYGVTKWQGLWEQEQYGTKFKRVERQKRAKKNCEVKAYRYDYTNEDNELRSWKSMHILLMQECSTFTIWWTF